MIQEKKPTPRSQQNQSSELYEALLAARTPGEQILWWGRPGVWRVMKKPMGVFTFGCSWLGISTLIFLCAPDVPRGLLAILLLIFLAVGIVFATIADFQKATRTVYGITDTRILTVILDRKGEETVEYYLPTASCRFEIVTWPDGSGDLMYAKRIVKDSEGDTHTEFSTLTGIPNIREVEQLIQKTFLSEKSMH